MVRSLEFIAIHIWGDEHVVHPPSYWQFREQTWWTSRFRGFTMFRQLYVGGWTSIVPAILMFTGVTVSWPMAKWYPWHFFQGPMEAHGSEGPIAAAGSSLGQFNINLRSGPNISKISKWKFRNLFLRFPHGDFNIHPPRDWPCEAGRDSSALGVSTNGVPQK